MLTVVHQMDRNQDYLKSQSGVNLLLTNKQFENIVIKETILVGLCDHFQ